MSVSPAAQSGPPRGPLFSQQQDGACQHSQVEGRTGPTSPVPFPHPIFLPHRPSMSALFSVECKTPRVEPASVQVMLCVLASVRHTQRFKKTKQKRHFIGGVNNTRQWTDSTKPNANTHTHSLALPQARRRGKNTRGKLSFPRVHATGFNDCSQQRKVQSCSLYRPAKTHRLRQYY